MSSTESQSDVHTVIDEENKIKDPEALSEEKKDTYLHGLRLAAVFLGLSLVFFVIILDQTVSY